MCISQIKKSAQNEFGFERRVTEGLLCGKTPI